MDSGKIGLRILVLYVCLYFKLVYGEYWLIRSSFVNFAFPLTRKLTRAIVAWDHGTQEDLAFNIVNV